MTIREILEDFKQKLDSNLVGDGQALDRQENYFQEALSAIQQEILRMLPEERFKPSSIISVNVMDEGKIMGSIIGFNLCLSQIKQKIEEAK